MRSQRTLTLVEIGLTVALSAVFSIIAVRLPINIAGGTISFAMLPILVIALRRGIWPGVAAGLAFGLIDYYLEPYFVAYAQVALDYFIAFGAVGLAGLGSGLYRRAAAESRTKGAMYAIPFILLGGTGRFVSAWLSGIVYYGQNAPAGQPVWLYSAIYNLSYIVPSLLLCVVGAALVLPALELALPASGRTPATAS
jgi:thiamine transporter